MKDTRPEAAPAPRAVLRCRVCGTRVSCPKEDILRFAEQGWPKCCDEIMSLSTALGRRLGGVGIDDLAFGPPTVEPPRVEPG